MYPNDLDLSHSVLILRLSRFRIRKGVEYHAGRCHESDDLQDGPPWLPDRLCDRLEPDILINRK